MEQSLTIKSLNFDIKDDSTERITKSGWISRTKFGDIVSVSFAFRMGPYSSREQIDATFRNVAKRLFGCMGAPGAVTVEQMKAMFQKKYGKKKSSKK
jgi:hypothetical protein